MRVNLRVIKTVNDCAMITEASEKNELFIEIDEAVAALDALVSSLDENKLNIVPYEGSWTAGQLVRHIVKSTDGMAKAMLQKSRLAERNIAERVPELQKVFLDFSSKMRSPEFIVPEDEHYERLASIEELNASFRQFRENTDRVHLYDVVEGLPLGPITKLEILHFVLYHTQRHLNQMKKICDVISLSYAM
jgi:hypothetical protein